MGGISNVVEFTLPELKGQEEVYGSIWKDLNQRGLIDTASINTTMSRNGMLSSRTKKMEVSL
jgi:hypothetical protein